MESLIVKANLLVDDDFMFKCLIKLHSLQEKDEQRSHSTNHQNGRGFNKSDASLMSMYADFEKSNNRYLLKDAEIIDLRKRIQKYATQLSHYLNDEGDFI